MHHTCQEPDTSHNAHDNYEHSLCNVRHLVECVIALLLVTTEADTVDDAQENEVSQVKHCFEDFEPFPPCITHHVEIVLDVCHQQYNEHSHLHHLYERAKVAG